MLQIRKTRKVGFFAMLLALLGIGGCEAIDDVIDQREMMAMYGTPTALFSAKGTVTDENGQPIQGLQVVLGRRYYDSGLVMYDRHYFPVDTLSTDANGEYRFSGTIYPVVNLQVDVNDIDGTAGGGEFNSTTTVVKGIEYKGGDGWYRGKADVQVPDIKLSKK